MLNRLAPPTTKPVSKKTISVQSVQAPKPINKVITKATTAKPVQPVKKATKASSVAARTAVSFKEPKGMVMERVQTPKFVPSQPIPSVPTSSRRQRTRKAHYDARLERNYGPAHPVTKMLNWEATRL